MSKNLSGINSVAGDYKLITVVPTLSTDQYAAGDVLAATAELADVCLKGGTCTLESVKIIDNDDKKSDFDILILNANTAVGTINSAYSGADTVTDDIMTIVPVVEADYVDMINAQAAFLSASTGDYGCGVVLAPAAEGSSLWYALISRDTDTFSAAGLEITFAFRRH